MATTTTKQTNQAHALTILAHTFPSHRHIINVIIVAIIIVIVIFPLGEGCPRPRRVEQELAHKLPLQPQTDLLVSVCVCVKGTINWFSKRQDVETNVNFEVGGGGGDGQ